jgi:cytochrome c553
MHFYVFNGGFMRVLCFSHRMLGMWIALCLGAWGQTAHAQNADMAERIKPCVACHGDMGRAGPDGYYPRLAGKPAGYLFNQMQNFSHGRRRYLMMRRMMEPLSADYQREMAQYFSQLQVPYAAPSAAKSLSAEQALRGRQLATQGDVALGLPACESCHGQGLTGQGMNVPSLVGLPAAYLSAQLSAWRTGDRQTQAPDCMAEIAKRLQPEDVHAVVGWMSQQPVIKVATSKSIINQRALPEDLRCGSAPELHGRAP